MASEDLLYSTQAVWTTVITLSVRKFSAMDCIQELSQKPKFVQTSVRRHSDCLYATFIVN